MRCRLPTIAFGLALLAGAAGSPAEPAASAGPIPQLIRELADPRWEVREESLRALIARGGEVVEDLTAASRSRDPEVAQRARLILAIVDPLILRVRIQHISLRRPPRVLETLECEGRVSREEAGELELVRGTEAGVSRPRYSYIAQYTLLPEEDVELSLEEIAMNTRTPLVMPGTRKGAVGILKRGEEGTYRETGMHLERDRHPFVVTIKYWTERRSSRGGPGAGAAAPGAGPGVDPAPAEGAGQAEEGVVELARELVRQAESDHPSERAAALELLGLLAVPPAGEALRKAAGRLPAAGGEAAAEGRDLRLAGLVGLARMGEGGAVEALAAELSAGSDSVEEDGSPEMDGTTNEGTGEEGTARGGRKGNARAPVLAPTNPGRVTRLFWPTRAALVLVEAGHPAGFAHFARSLADIDPADFHQVLVTLADHLERTPAEVRGPLAEALAAPDFLIHLPWDDPEVEHFFVRAAAHLLGNGRLPAEGEPAEEREENRDRLLLSLARVILGESGVMPGRQQRLFARLWHHMTGGGRDPHAARGSVELAGRVLRETLDAGLIPQRLEELLAWLPVAFRGTPIPEADFREVLDLCRTLRRVNPGLPRVVGSPELQLVDLARQATLTEAHLTSLALLLAEMAGLPGSPELVLELERLTGLRLPPGRPGQGLPAPAGQAGRAAAGRGQASGAAGVRTEETALQAVQRWAADPARVREALARLEPQRYLNSGHSMKSGTEGERLLYREFTLSRPSASGAASLPRIGGLTPPLSPPLVPPRGQVREVRDEGVEVVAAVEREVQAGVPFQIEDRRGNTLTLRLDPDHSAQVNPVGPSAGNAVGSPAGGAVGSPAGGAVPASRYRLNGQSILELDSVSRVSLRERTQRTIRWEFSDVRLNPLVLDSQFQGRTIQHIAWLRRAPSPPEQAGTEEAGAGVEEKAGEEGAPAGEARGGGPPREAQELWKEFVETYFAPPSGKGPGLKPSALNLVMEFKLREALPHLAAELQRTGRQDIALILVQMGDPAGKEFFRKELEAPEALRRFHAARQLAGYCDRMALRGLLGILRDRPPEVQPHLYSSILTSLDTFLQNCSPTEEEKAEVVSLLVERLHEPIFQPTGFRVLGRQLGNDFGYSQALSNRSNPQTRKQLLERAVEEARAFWKANRPR